MDDLRRELMDSIKKINLTEEEISRRTGISVKTISRYLNNPPINPNREKARKIISLATGEISNDVIRPLGEDDRLYQLTLQIKMLQEDVGCMKRDIMELRDGEVAKKKPSDRALRGVPGHRSAQD